MPDLPWSVRIQIFWSSPEITPCDMHWLSHELANQIYSRSRQEHQEPAPVVQETMSGPYLKPFEVDRDYDDDENDEEGKNQEIEDIMEDVMDIMEDKAYIDMSKEGSGTIPMLEIVDDNIDIEIF